MKYRVLAFFSVSLIMVLLLSLMFRSATGNGYHSTSPPADGFNQVPRL